MWDITSERYKILSISATRKAAIATKSKWILILYGVFCQSWHNIITTYLCSIYFQILLLFISYLFSLLILLWCRKEMVIEIIIAIENKIIM